MKHIMSIIIGVFLLAVIAVLAVPRPVQAGDRDDCDYQKPKAGRIHGDKNGWQVPVAVIAISAGAWCWFECGKDNQPEPLPDPGPAVKNDITPGNLKDKPRKFLIEK